MSRMLTSVFVSLALLCGAAATVSASTFTWSGGQPGNLWGDAANWGGTVPTGGDTAQFNTANQTPVDVAASATVGEISFQSTAIAYTINGTGPLTINGVGGGGVNNIAATAQTETLGVSSIALGGSQTWNNTGTLVVSGGSLDFAAHTLTVAGTGTTTISDTLTGGGALIKNGTGTLNLDAPFSGTVNVNGGTLALRAAQTALGVTLATGTLTQGAGIGNSSFGELTILGNPTVNLDSTGTGRLEFNGARWISGTLFTINNWQGTAGSAGTAGTIFITGTGPEATFLSHLSNISFTGFAPGATVLGTGELVPVPEPSTYAAIFALGLLSFAIARRQVLARA